jgi:hypothetical protein
MACCVLIAYVLSRILQLFRRDAESRTDPQVLQSVTIAKPAERKAFRNVH